MTNYPLFVPDLPIGRVEVEARSPFRIRVVLSAELTQEQRAALEEVEVFSSDSLLDGSVLESPLKVAIDAQEGRIETDLSLLMNLAEISKLRRNNPEVKRWFLVTRNEESVEDPEFLVQETIRQVTGVLAGCDIEIHQGPTESFGSLWARVNVSRLLAWESQLQDLPDPLSGAGLFEALAGLS